MVMGMMTLQCGVAGIPVLEAGSTRVCKGLVSTLAIHKPASGIRRLGSVKLKSGLVEPLRLTGLSQGSFLSGQSLGLVHRQTQLTFSKDLSVEAKAYEAGAGAGEGDVEKEDVVVDFIEPVKQAPRLKLGAYFFTWWTLNVIFNIYNKKVLNVFPFPWCTSTITLAVGVAIMCLSWLTGITEKPDVDAEFWKALAPVALAHTIGHVAAVISMSKVAVSFTHIIKSAEPAFSVILQRLLFGQGYPSAVYLSLVPIIGGCGLAAATELNFNMTGFVGAMISNLAFVFRNIFSKKGMVGKNVGGSNYYACLSIMSLAFLTPFAILMEGPKLWSAGWTHAVNTVGPQFAWWVAAQSVFYHLYNQVSYMSLNEISPLTFSIGNTMKRVSVIVASIIIFQTPVRPINAVGAFIAIFGTFLYSQARQ